MFFKSGAELKYAKCLEFLRRQTTGDVLRWIYEPEKLSLNFPDNDTKHRAYKPDFEVVYEGGQVWLIEIKGQLTASEAKKLLTFKKFYPQKNLMLLIDGLPRRLTTEGIRRWKRLHKIMDAGIKVSNLKTVLKSFKKIGVI